MQLGNVIFRAIQITLFVNSAPLYRCWLNDSLVCSGIHGSSNTQWTISCGIIMVIAGRMYINLKRPVKKHKKNKDRRKRIGIFVYFVRFNIYFKCTITCQIVKYNIGVSFIHAVVSSFILPIHSIKPLTKSTFLSLNFPKLQFCRSIFARISKIR